ncbi:hypothetical protein MPSEU_000249000 [Mayamaea pseudoterrestris]|nr:hypothetical protein MPSEU_000249000 [Mayamaea pseudoterrestris]
MASLRFLSSLLSMTLLHQVSCSHLTSMQELENYRLYPRRTAEEAAVLEWGHSAVISALDASVAHFGPQTSQAALLEVEAMPIFAEPLNGVQEEDVDVGDGTTERRIVIQKLKNAEEVHGNVCVMTNQGKKLTGVQMAQIAQLSGAAALLLVNTNEKRPEDVFRLPADEGSENIEIPVVMISLNSANVLTTATVTQSMQTHEIVNNGMPERVRLYAGGDRPFFEDVETTNPVVYLIHNLLTDDECDSLIRRAGSRFRPAGKTPDTLQLIHDAETLVNVETVALWQGLLQGPAQKAIEERIEQVTGFPSSHFSDFTIHKFEAGSYWNAHYDNIGVDQPMATVTIFLNDDVQGGEFVYPATRTDPIKIRATKAMAVVHHNTDEHRDFDFKSLHGLLPPSGRLYVARKYIYATPVSHARRIALPLFALPFGGTLPGPVLHFYRVLVEKFGEEQGGMWFDKVCVFLPILLILLGVQYGVDAVQKKLKAQAKAAPAEAISNDKKKRKKQ